MFFAYIGLCIAPMLSNYVFYDAISIGDLLIMLSLLFFLRLKKSSITNANQLLRLIFLVAFFVMCVVIIITQNGSYINPGFYRFLFYALILLTIPFVNINNRYYWVVSEALAIVFSISLLIQFAFFQAGYILPIKLPLQGYELDALEISDHIYRGGGWFREPSYFALYLFPIMLYQAREFKWKPFALNAIAIIVSTSSIGFIIFAALIYDRVSRKDLSIKKNSLIVLTLLIFFTLVLVAFQDSIIISRFIENIKGGGSFAIRVLPLIEYFDEIFQFIPLQSENSSILFLSGAGDVWISSAVYFMALFGVIAFLIFLLGLTYLDRFTYLLFLILIFSTSILSTSFSVYLVIGFFGVSLSRKIAPLGRESVAKKSYLSFCRQ